MSQGGLTGTGHTAGLALRYLMRRRLVNRVRDARRRMREPRYLLGAVVGVVYFGAIIWFMLRPQGDDEISGVTLPVIVTLVSPLLAIFTVSWWLAGKSHTTLAFEPAEAQLLFQAPLTRQTLVRYKLARSQSGVIATALFFTLFLQRYADLGFLPLAISLWMLVTTVHLHQMAAALVRTRWTQYGQQGRRRPWITAGFFALWVVLLAVGFADLVPALRRAGTWPQAWLAFEIVRSDPAAALALLPIEIALAPISATDLASWAWLSCGAAGLLVVHYYWVLQTDAAFEETAADAGEEAAALIAAAKQGRVLAYQLSRQKKLPPPWFRLSPRGHRRSHSSGRTSPLTRARCGPSTSRSLPGSSSRYTCCS